MINSNEGISRPFIEGAFNLFLQYFQVKENILQETNVQKELFYIFDLEVKDMSIASSIHLLLRIFPHLLIQRFILNYKEVNLKLEKVGEKKMKYFACKFCIYI